MKVLRQEQGMVLLMVLVVVALLAALVTELAFSTLVDLRLTETFRDSTRAYYLAKGGVRAGRGILQRDKNGYDAPDDPAEFWSQGVAQYPVGDGVVSVQIEDLDGRISLNALVVAGSSNVNPTVKNQLLRLLDNLGIGDGDMLVAALIDWLDSDDQIYVDPEGGQGIGAESGHYLQTTPPLRCKNGALQNLDELPLVRGFTPEIVRQLTPFVACYGSEKINVNSAAAEVLMALSDDPVIKREAAQAIIERRRETPFKTEEALSWINGLPGLENLLREPLTVTSSVFRIEAEALVGDGVRRVEAIVNKNSDQLLYIKVD